MNRVKIQPKNFSEPIGAYSHGLKVSVGNSEMIFVTGQIAIDKDGNVVGRNDPEKQAEYVFQNIKVILEEAGASINDVVKSQIFVTDIDDFQKISTVRNKYFSESQPVSTLVEVTRLVKEGCCIEVEVIAIKPQHQA